MKTCLKILNLFLLGISALAAVLHFVFVGPITESSNLIIYIGAFSAIFMTVVLLIMTVFLPERKEIPIQQQPFRRIYEPAITLVWLSLQGLCSVFTFISGNKPLKILTILLLVSIALLMLCHFGLKYICYKEQRRHVPILPYLLPTLIILAILLIGIGGGLVKDKWDQKSRIPVSHKISQKQQDNASVDTQEFYTKDILARICEDYPEQEIYYKMQETQDGSLNVLVWTKAEDEVVIYQFTPQDDGYLYNTAFLSNTISKKDVEGKEDGKIDFSEP